MATALIAHNVKHMGPVTESSLKWPVVIGALCVVGFVVLLGGIGKPKVPSVPGDFKVKNYFDPSKPIGAGA